MRHGIAAELLRPEPNVLDLDACDLRQLFNPAVVGATRIEIEWIESVAGGQSDDTSR